MRRLIRLFSVALFMSFVVSVFYYKIISPEPYDSYDLRPVVTMEECLSERENRVLVVVSEINREPGDGLIDESTVKRIKYPEVLLPRYAPLDVKDVLGMEVSVPIYRGEILSLQRLIDAEDASAPLGFRDVVTWRSLVISGGKGYRQILARGMYVDVLALYQAIPFGKTKAVEICRTVAHNARILEIGNKAAARLKNQSIADEDEAIIFDLTAKSASIIDLIKLQKVSFFIALRSAGRSGNQDTCGFAIDQLENACSSSAHGKL